MTGRLLLQIAVWLPLATGLGVLAMPASRPRRIRGTALAGALATLLAVALVWASFERQGGLGQLAVFWPWIPGIGAHYAMAVDGISLAMLSMTALLFAVVAIYVLPLQDRAKGHAFLFLLMETGLLGVFVAQDLILFYLFFEVGLVPMYFIIAGWGHEGRRHAAIKFFLYTRTGSLAMLLSFLAMYLVAGADTFSIPALAQRAPLIGSAPAASLVVLGLLLGFGVKVPIVPLHNWLPDAHVEAPTEGSVVLAAVQLKLGGYGLVRVLMAIVPGAAASWGWVFVGLGLVSLIYGALAALAQRDFKRLIAYTSIAHMGYVTLGVGVAALASMPAVRELAINGAVFQMVSHGLLTGAMFLLAGMLEERAGTREMSRLGDLLSRSPSWAGLLALLAFGSLGLPGLSGFVAEMQVIGASVGLSGWVALGVLIGLAITTALYIVVIARLLMGKPPDTMPLFRRPSPRELGSAGTLALAAVLLGILPWPLLSTIGSATRALLYPSAAAQLEDAR